MATNSFKSLFTLPPTFRGCLHGAPISPSVFLRPFTTTRPSAVYAPTSRNPSSSANLFNQDFVSSLDSQPDLDAIGASIKHQAAQLPHRLNIFAHKHNTHLTLSRPAKQRLTPNAPALDSTKVEKGAYSDSVILSYSTGQIGFRKSARGSYDAAFQLAAFVLAQIQERGLVREIHELELVMRGFGKGREAVVKAVLGAEGRSVRGKVVKVSDATRLKFGGQRSPKPRRLG